MPGDRLKSTRPNGVGRFLVPGLAVFGAAILSVALLIAIGPAVADSEEVEVFGRRLVLAIPDGYCGLDERFELDRAYLAHREMAATEGLEDLGTYVPCDNFEQQRNPLPRYRPVFVRYMAISSERADLPSEIETREDYLVSLAQEEGWSNEQAFFENDFEWPNRVESRAAFGCLYTGYSAIRGENAQYLSKATAQTLLDTGECDWNFYFLAYTIINGVFLEIVWECCNERFDDDLLTLPDLRARMDDLIRRTIAASEQ